MKRFSLSFRIVFILLVVISCRQEEEISLRNYPFIESLGISDLNQTGVTVDFEVKKEGRAPIQEYGIEYFLSSPNSNPTEFADIFRVSRTGSPSDALVSLRINYDLVNQRNYLVRPYAKSGGATVYGELLPFNSLGTSPPVVTEVSPTSFYKNAIITIKGDFFNSRVENNEIRIPGLENDYRVTLISASNQELVMRVESISFNFQPTEEKFDLLINSGGKSVTLVDVFSILVPSIQSIEPNQVYVGDKLRIFTDNPDLATPYSFRLSASDILQQEIFPLTMLEGGIYEGEVRSLPSGPAQVTMSASFYSNTFSEPIEILPTWEVFQDGLNVPSFNEYRNYPFGDRLIFWRSNGNDQNEFYQLKVGNSSLEAFGDEFNQPFIRTSEMLQGLNDRYIYYGLGIEYTSNDVINHRDFHRYDLQTGRWERLADFPFDFSYVVKTFSAQGKIYAVMLNYLNFREYDPQIDQWTLSPIGVPTEVRNAIHWTMVGDYFYFVSSLSPLQVSRYRVGGEVEFVAGFSEFLDFNVRLSQWNGHLMIYDLIHSYRLDLNTRKFSFVQEIFESRFSHFMSWPTSQGFLQAFPRDRNSSIQENKVYRLIQEF